MTNDRAAQAGQLRLMRLASVLEATTLALLVFVAMPLKQMLRRINKKWLLSI